MGTRQWGRLFIVLAMTVVIAAGASAVSAHARLTAADPAANAVLPKAPTQVNLTFSEETSATKSGGSVTDASGATVSTGFKVDLNERTKMAITLKPDLPNGIYTVKWNTFTDNDSGMADGTFTFTVQAAATGSATTGTASAGAPVVAGTVPAVATAAPAATTAPIATTAPTATRPAPTPAAQSTSGTTTATTAPATLPKTGNGGSGSGAPWAIVVAFAAALAIAGGLAFRFRPARR